MLKSMKNRPPLHVSLNISWANKRLRSRPLVIWGGGAKIESEFIFSAGMPFENYSALLIRQPPIFFLSISSSPTPNHLWSSPKGVCISGILASYLASILNFQCSKSTITLNMATISDQELKMHKIGVKIFYHATWVPFTLSTCDHAYSTRISHMG